MTGDRSGSHRQQGGHCLLHTVGLIKYVGDDAKPNMRGTWKVVDLFTMQPLDAGLADAHLVFGTYCVAVKRGMFK